MLFRSLLTIKDVALANQIVHLLDAAEEVLKALIDDNPDNEAQLKAIWERRKGTLLAEGVDLATDKISDLIRQKVKDPVLANIIIDILQNLDGLVKVPENRPA